MAENNSFHRILVATDFSPASGPAVQEATKLAQKNGAELLIAHAYEPPSPLQVDGYVAPWIYNEWDETLRNEAEHVAALGVASLLRSGAASRVLILAATRSEGSFGSLALLRARVKLPILYLCPFP